MMKSRLWQTFLLCFTLLSSYDSYAAICEFEVLNEWNSGFTSRVTITNDTQQTFDGWFATLDFADASSINNMWDAVLSGSGPYQAANQSYNRTIAAGESVSFGFNTQKASLNSPAQIPVLGGVCLSDVNNAPIANATAPTLQGSIPFTVNLDASESLDPDGDELNYHWQFNDGTTASGVTTSRTFSEEGAYSVVLTVSDGQLQSSPAKLNITADMSAPTSAACEFIVDHEWNSGFTTSVHISNVSSQTIQDWQVSIQFPQASASITQIWNADLSGNTPYQASNKSYNSTIEPNSSITFGFNATKATNGAAIQPPILGGLCSGNIPINQAPVIDISTSPLQGTAPLTVEFDASASTDLDGDELTFVWDFGDGNSSSNAISTHDYSTAGSYTVSLTVTDSQQASSTQTLTVTAEETVSTDTYTLDAAHSSLFLVSTKNTHIIENHTFTALSGWISAQGEAVVQIDLDSIDSSIAQRDQRMRDVLFETTLFDQANASLSVDMTSLANLAAGHSIQQTITPQIDLHGVIIPLQTLVNITRINANTLLVQNNIPLLINAEDFALSEGIEALRALAGLNMISYTVPVNFTLLFNKP